MEIEVVTTKRRLTKQLLNQMKQATFDAMKRGDVLGYVLNCVKGCHRAVLVKHAREYFIIYADWQRGTKAVFRRIGKWTQRRDFTTDEELAKWWQAYQEASERAVEQIYI